MLTLPIDSEIDRCLEALGAHTDDRKSVLARTRLLEALREDLEEQAWIRVADERFAKDEKTYSLEEVGREFGIES